jgi:hypothetical protein
VCCSDFDRTLRLGVAVAEFFWVILFDRDFGAEHAGDLDNARMPEAGERACLLQEP